MMKTNHIVGLIANIREKAHHFIIQELKAHNIEGLVPSHGAILSQLYHQEEKIPMAELAKRIDRDKSTVTTLVDKLVEVGYVRKVKEPNDRRMTYIVLTEQGQSIKPVIQAISHKMLAQLYAGFSDLEKEMLVRLLERMLQNM
ncbi:transcriptional regulator, MarR family [Candidatus Vecturithrix granuli]|uniref:Transcriptional regulator, MarR family n=1 Tax=Vecturithrix granuli TaxID=1499967 RepID=A0A081C1S5_VECG1|nr:transcriptional regulator, MarR family [Candidatus Vecturithrix granuli]